MIFRRYKLFLEENILKTRRSDRLIDMTRYLLERPHTLISLTFFSERYESAKSSISEDLAIIKRTFKLRGIGLLETIPGAAGGAAEPRLRKQGSGEDSGEFHAGLRGRHSRRLLIR